jgi:uncharacterized protein
MIGTRERFVMAIQRLVVIGALVIAPARAFATPTCTGNAIVTLDEGAITNVEWPTRSASELAGRVITNETLETAYELQLRPDGSVATASLTPRTIEKTANPTKVDVTAGAVYWSDRIPSTLEQIVLRARALGGTTARVPLVASSKDVPHEARVDKLDANDFSIAVGPRNYDVFVDDHGCMLSATLAAYGIGFERREIAPAAYPLEGQYAAPHDAPYTATDVKIPAPEGHVLGGTLTRPKRGGRLPAVVMITGISKHERNEGLPPFTPFRDIADVLGRAGIAVLRVDDRGVGASTGDFDKATSFDEANDVRTEIAWLRKQPGIDPARVGVVGHSEGGFIALVVGATDPSLAAIVVLAGSGVPGEQLMSWQAMQTVDHDPSIAPDKREAEIHEAITDRHDWSPRDIAFVASDPMDYARRVMAPTLVVQGGSDLHVPPRSAERIVETERAVGNPDATAKIIPQLSHTLCPDIIGSIQAWSWLPSRRLSTELLTDVTTWLTAELFKAGKR